MSSVITMQAEEKSDTLTQQLNEIVVEAELQRENPEIATFIPEIKQKEASADAVSLLARMGIPKLSVDAIAQTVKTTSGEEVSIFIDYLAATSDDLTGMRMKDVKKIEVLDYPSDPRFKGAKHVVNFVMQQYEYGGYVKLYDQGSVGEHLFVNNAKVNMKFNYKKMTYDLVAGTSYNKVTQLGTSEHSIFKFPATETTPERTIERYLDSGFDNLRQENSVYASLRARYNTEKIQISNMIGFNLWKQPHYDDSGSLRFVPEITPATTFEQTQDMETNTLSWDGSYYFALPNDFAISANPSIQYSTTKKNSDYIVNNSSLINNIADDKTFYGQLQLTGSKKLNEKFKLTFDLYGIIVNNDVKYSGSTVDEVDLGNQVVAPTFGLTYRIPKFYLSLDAGYAWMWETSNNSTEKKSFPVVNLSTNYTITDKLSWNTWTNVSLNMANAAQRSDIMQQQNEFLWAVGSTELTNSPQFSIGSSATWMPSNKFQTTPWFNFFHQFDTRRYLYTPGEVNGQPAIIKQLGNHGDLNALSAGISFNVKLLSSKLQINANPWISHYTLTATPKENKTHLATTLGAYYYAGKFNFSLGYTPAMKSFSSESGIETKYGNSYWIGAGWTSGDWTIQAYGMNIFTRSKISSRSYLETPYYSNYSALSDGNKVPAFHLTVSYTIGFGKKINRGDDLESIGKGNNGILE